MWIGHRKEIRKLTFRALAFVGANRLDSLRRRANARNVSFRISLRWPLHIINPVDKIQLSRYTSHRRSTTVSLETYPSNQNLDWIITCSWPRGAKRGKVYERVTIGLGLTSDWMKKWREFCFDQSCSLVDVKPITFRHSNENHSTPLKVIHQTQKTVFYHLVLQIFSWPNLFTQINNTR